MSRMIELQTEHGRMAAVSMILDRIPTIEAEPVRHGRCISDIYGMKCSECDSDLYESSINFCPNCGAKMDGGNPE